MIRITGILSIYGKRSRPGTTPVSTRPGAYIHALNVPREIGETWVCVFLAALRQNIIISTGVQETGHIKDMLIPSHSLVPRSMGNGV